MSEIVASAPVVRELNIAVIGGVDCGKSTLLSVLKNGDLDDGKGLARSKIVKYKHEFETGRTSAITQHYVPITESKICCFIDLCGHEQYLHTTLHGMCGFYVDFAIIVVGGNLSITEMTKEHMNTCLSLNIPFMVVITKIDSSPPHVLAKTKEVILELLSQKVKGRNVIWMKEGMEEVRQLQKNIPIFCVSNKTGESIDLLRNFIFGLPIRKVNQMEEGASEGGVLFSIDAFFQVKGVGPVVSGKLLKGKLSKNDKLMIGPLQGQFFSVTARSFHDNFKNGIDGMECGMSGCVGLKMMDKNVEIKNIRHRKGSYLMTPRSLKEWSSGNDEEMRKSMAYYEFEADVIVIGSHSTQISLNYQPVINCKKIVQCARILEIDDREYIRPGEMSKIHFRFVYRPEFLQVGDRFIFREGTTRGVGIIRKLIPNEKTEEENAKTMARIMKFKMHHMNKKGEKYGTSEKE
jgi:GTPase